MFKGDMWHASYTGAGWCTDREMGMPFACSVMLPSILYLRLSLLGPMISQHICLFIILSTFPMCWDLKAEILELKSRNRGSALQQLIGC